VWELLADTDRVDREIGLPPVQFEFLPRRAGGSDLIGTVQLGRLKVRYREDPYEWVRPEFYSVRRRFEGGPVAEFRTRFTFAEEQNGTRVTCVTDFLPRWPVLAPLTALVAQKLMGDLHGGWRTFSDYLTGQIATPYPKHCHQFPPDRVRLNRAVAMLGAVSGWPEMAQKLGAFLAEATPEEVVLIRPFALADAWNADRMTVLQLCLFAATRSVELLNLRWRLLCPMCRGSVPQNVAQRLRDVTESVHCPSCNIAFHADFDRAVEVCFSVAQRVRPVQEAHYCIGGPGMSPHVAAQWYLAPGETRSVAFHQPPGRYTLVSPQTLASINLMLTEQTDPTLSFEARLEPRAERLAWSVPETCLRVGTTGTLTNLGSEPAVARLESQEITYPVATAAQVTSLQAFRDNFSGEVLSPGTELAVQQVCVLFSDLKGSTAMYREQGDAPSYRRVRDHFDFMRRWVNAFQGAVVKTIGDSVMATFTDPAHGVAAALAIQEEARTLPDGLVVKLGLHAGPAIAVNANDLLDYFGQTVNLAARLESESEGDDLVVAAELVQDPRVADLLAEHRAHLAYFTHTVRGFDTPLAMARITLPPLP
jgi:class 3 adenylate cyclase